MRHRIRAGVILFNDNDELLLIKHDIDGETWWATPGGGVEGTETAHETAVREVWEETGLDIELGPLAFINTYQTSANSISIIFHATYDGGEPHLDNLTAEDDHVTGVAWLSKKDLHDANIKPSYLKGALWDDKKQGFPAVRYLDNGQPEDLR